MADRRENPELRRYDSVGYGSAIYLLQVGECGVKVGRADAIRRRLGLLHVQLKREGRPLGNFAVFTAQQRNLHAIERACIKALRRVAAPIGTHREYFTGIAFDDAALLVAEVIAAEAA